MTLPVRPWQQVGNSSGFTRITSRDFEFDNDPNVELSLLGIMGNLSKCWQPAMNMGFSVPEVPTCFSTSVQPHQHCHKSTKIDSTQHLGIEACLLGLSKWKVVSPMN